MKHLRIVLVLCASLSPMLALTFACTGEEKQAAPRGKDSGVWDKVNPAQNEKKKEKEKEIRTEPEAVRVMLTINETQVTEAAIGKARTKSSAVRGLAEEIATDHTAANARLKELIDSKGIAPQGNNMSDRLKFNSTASVNHLRNVGLDMFDNAYTTRAVNSQKEFLKNIDEDIAPIVVDEDLKAEVAQLRSEIAKHVADAQSVADGVTTVAPGNTGAGVPPPNLEAGAGGGGGGGQGGGGPGGGGQGGGGPGGGGQGGGQPGPNAGGDAGGGGQGNPQNP